MFLYFCLWLFKSLSQMAFYFSNLILQTAIDKFDGLRIIYQEILAYIPNNKVYAVLLNLISNTLNICIIGG